jgi:small GTP-binding protein
MLKKKICMLGSYGVGKTSLIRSFVYSIFEDRYHSTVGVKIDKKIVEFKDQTIEFLLWDIAGEDERFTVPISYLLGASGYLLVIDGTRKDTLDKALDLQLRTEEAVGEIPFLLVLNKADLEDNWELDQKALDALEKMKCIVVKTSAKLGTGVNEAFYKLGQEILANS